jgi:tetratricopeptide (TPR) repeat protein
MIDEKTLGPSHPEVAMDLTNLGLIVTASGRVSEAEQPIRRAISIFQNTLSADHPNVAASLVALAQVLQAMNQMGEAEQLYSQAIVILQDS